MEINPGYLVVAFIAGGWLGIMVAAFICGAHITEEKQGSQRHE